MPAGAEEAENQNRCGNEKDADDLAAAQAITIGAGQDGSTLGRFGLGWCGLRRSGLRRRGHGYSSPGRML